MEIYLEYWDKLNVRLMEKIVIWKIKENYKLLSNEYIIKNYADFLKYKRKVRLKLIFN